MYKRVDLEYESENKLSKEVYTFILFDDLRMKLDRYADMRRDTVRHKYKTVASYDRTMTRNNTINANELPVITALMIQQASQKFYLLITFEPPK